MQRDPISRRRFLYTTGAAAAGAGVLLSRAPAILAQDDDRKLKVGVVGCGGRGTGAAKDSMRAYGTEISALADVVATKAEAARRSFKVDKSRTFVGMDAFKKLLETDVDYVILATPPHFRPEHFEACIDAGKHVFMEKPVAVDPVGVRRVIEAGRKATEKGLSVVAGTQRRHQKSYLETVKRVEDGAIGKIVAARCYWCQGGLWVFEKQPGMSNMEWMVRNWLYFAWLSGDHIVEQHIHNLDVINWFMGSTPISARGIGGREVRKDPKYGNIFDHHVVEYEYPGGARMTSMCRQIGGCWNDVSEHVVGTKGEANCNGRIMGENEWRFPGGGRNPYVQEHADLVESIREGKGLNEAKRVAESTLTAIMGRMATYTGQVQKWDEVMKSDLKLGPPSYDYDSDWTPPPVAVPGRS